MYYIKDGMVFEPCEEGFVEVSVTVKNKVVTTSELESITVTPSSHIEASLEGASVATFEEVMSRFSVSEDNPITAKGATAEAPAKESGAKKTPAKKTAKK